MTTIAKTPTKTIKKTPTLVQLKIDADLKNESKAFFQELGLSFTDGVKIYLKYITKNRKIPFVLTTLQIPDNLPVVTPSPELESRINESMEKIQNGTAKLISFDSKKARDMFFFGK
jgi:addiction module RelB/DinJ family antitoxin